MVQLYVGDPVASVSRPVKELKGFERRTLAVGERATVSFTIGTEALAFSTAREVTDFGRVWEAGAFDIAVGPNSRDAETIRVFWNEAAT